MAAPIPQEAAKEIELVKGLVARHFPVYDVRVNYDVVEFYVRTDNTMLEEAFEQLREEMGAKGYIPMISYVGGEHVVTVARKPTVKYRSTTVNVVMLAVTLVSTIIAGAYSWAGYEGLSAGDVFSGSSLLMGFLTFALPVMAILGIHELGHYFMARRRRVAASLPFFMPFLPPLGTLGAFISLRDPIPNKKTMLEIGVAGPISGFLLTIPIALLGLGLTNMGAKPVPVNVGSEGVVGVSFPVVYMGLSYLIPPAGDYLLHPTAFAAWVGFLVTALNLLPAGQLDGGHIARALLGARAKYLSWVVIAILIGMSFAYPGWILFALLVLFLGTKHPPPLNDISGLDAKRKGLGVFAFAILIVAFVPVPVNPIAADYSFEMVPLEDLNATIPAGGGQVFNIRVDNTGNALNEIMLVKSEGTALTDIRFKAHGASDASYDSSLHVYLNASENATVDVSVTLSSLLAPGDNASAVIRGTSMNTSIAHVLRLNLTTGTPSFAFYYDQSLTVAAGGNVSGTISIENLGANAANLTVDASSNLPSMMDVLVYAGNVTDPGVTGYLNVTVAGDANVTIGFTIFVWPPEPAGQYVLPVSVLYEEEGTAVLLRELLIDLTVT